MFLNAEQLETHNFGKTFLRLATDPDHSAEFIETVLDEADGARSIEQSIMQAEGRHP